MDKRLVGAALLVGLAILVNYDSLRRAKGDTPSKTKAAEVVKKLKGTKIISIQDVDKIRHGTSSVMGACGAWDGSVRSRPSGRREIRGRAFRERRSRAPAP